MTERVVKRRTLTTDIVIKNSIKILCACVRLGLVIILTSLCSVCYSS